MADTGWSSWVGDPLEGGWLGVQSEGLPGRLFVRFEAAPNGRLRPVDLVLFGDREPITGTHLRNLPVHRLEIDANDLLGDALGPSEDAEAVQDVRAMLGDLFAEFGKAWSARHRRRAEREGRIEREPVRRPIGKDRPDDFYRTVAAAYNEAVRGGIHPGPAIAAEAAVSVRTAQGWVAEARKRGILPPSQRASTGQS